VEKLLKISEQNWTLARRRERVLSQLAKEEGCSQQMIQWACSKLGLSRAMVFRLLARYRDDKGLSTLVPQTRGRKLGRRLLSPKQEKIISQQIHKFYFRRERPSLAALHREIATDCAKSRIPIPSYGSLARRLRIFDQTRRTKRN
jgi:putative transposase